VPRLLSLHSRANRIYKDKIWSDVFNHNNPGGCYQEIIEFAQLPPNVGDPGSIPGLGRAPGVGNANSFQYSFLENPMDRGAWWAIVYDYKELDTTEHAHRETSVKIQTETNSF